MRQQLAEQSERLARRLAALEAQTVETEANIARLRLMQEQAAISEAARQQVALDQAKFELQMRAFEEDRQTIQQQLDQTQAAIRGMPTAMMPAAPGAPALVEEAKEGGGEEEEEESDVASVSTVQDGNGGALSAVRAQVTAAGYTTQGVADALSRLFRF
jgi:chromosome segregation ATPase